MPIPWTKEALETTWLASQRLLLFVRIAEPKDRMQAQLELDSETVLVGERSALPREGMQAQLELDSETVLVGERSALPREGCKRSSSWTARQ